ncbi:hypothetical protein AMS68_006683 [Peltaster fructicola]|uniref:Uncharacterized protein n=1 Tax=Peltaster fructicola TaxID=286661 RepID=A0A6H0Y2K2_9PEZI|nr:hypothetical protein AMS68_006683 [Peltaster fructicola]
MFPAELEKATSTGVPPQSALQQRLRLTSRKYVHETTGDSFLLSYLKTTPPNTALALGTATRLPPKPEHFTQNDDFMKIVHWVIKDNAVDDPAVKAQAAMFASQAGAGLGSGGVFFGAQRQTKRSARRHGGGADGDGAGGASAQGGMGGAGRGGYIHVSDQRNPPDFGRVAWPEDIFGSLELDGQGNFVEPKGRYQEAGTYRMCTNEGLLELSPFLREKVLERVKELESQARRNT